MVCLYWFRDDSAVDKDLETCSQYYPATWSKKEKDKKEKLRKPLSLKFLSTVDPWKHEFELKEFYLHTDFFNSNTTVLHHPRLSKSIDVNLGFQETTVKLGMQEGPGINPLADTEGQPARSGDIFFLNTNFRKDLP